MAELDKNNPYRKALVALIVSISDVVPMAEENQVLLLYKLNTEEKISRFNEWVKSRMKGETLMATEAEITRAAVQIARRS